MISKPIMSGAFLLFAFTMGCSESLFMKESDPTDLYALLLLPGTAGPNPGGTDTGNEDFGLLPTSGKVKAFQKISDTQGNFQGTLADGDQFGTSIAAIGDLDNDGIMDLAVGAEGDDDGGNSRGAVWILFMNENGMVRSSQKISDTEGNFTGTLTDNTHFGGGIAPLGDLDGDGVEDIVVSAKDDDDGGGPGSNHGALWVLFLDTDGTVKSHQKISDTAGNFTGTLELGDHFGTSVAAIGDVNKDGTTDIAAGAYFDDDGNAGGNRGAVWILFLNSNGTVKSHQKISDTLGDFAGSLDDSDQFGESVTGPGDINGDGTPDLVVGTPDDRDDGNVYGSIWVLFLNTSGDGTVSSYQKISDTQGNFAGIFADAERFGRAIGAPGDLDGDGVVDLLSSSFGDDGAGVDRGAINVLFMNRDGTVKSHQKISDTEGNFAGVLKNFDHFGSSVTAIGDINGDRIPDLVVGARYDDDGAAGDDQRGAVWVLNLDE